MITYEEYRNAINEVLNIGIKNNNNLKYMSDPSDMKRVSELRKIIYQYEYENKKELKPKKKSLIKRLFKK